MSYMSRFGQSWFHPTAICPGQYESVLFGLKQIYIFLPDPGGAGHVEAFQFSCVCVSGHFVNSIVPNSQLLKAWASGFGDWRIGG